MSSSLLPQSHPWILTSLDAKIRNFSKHGSLDTCSQFLYRLVGLVLWQFVLHRDSVAWPPEFKWRRREAFEGLLRKTAKMNIGSSGLDLVRGSSPVLPQA